jgi:hypothetical protein
MIGYHYTSADNWQSIRDDGLIPYLIDHPHIVHLGVGAVYGIFVWPKRPRGICHVGNIMFQVGSKGTTRIVRLEIAYTDRDIWTNIDGDRLRLVHHGALTASRAGLDSAGMAYHVNEPAVILGRHIEPERISLTGEWDLIERLDD